MKSKKLTKFLAILLAVSMVTVSFTACGNKEKNSDKKNKDIDKGDYLLFDLNENKTSYLVMGISSSAASNVTNITIPSTYDNKSVITIRSCAFEGYRSLASIVIPNSITNIEGWAFWNCSSLKSIVIPKSVVKIGRGTFTGCSSLTDIYCEAERKPYDWIQDDFGSWKGDCSATVHWGDEWHYVNGVPTLK